MFIYKERQDVLLKENSYDKDSASRSAWAGYVILCKNPLCDHFYYNVHLVYGINIFMKYVSPKI